MGILIPLCYMVVAGVEETRLEGSQVFAISNITITEMKEPQKMPQAYGLIASPFMAVAFLTVGLGGYYYVGDAVHGMVSELMPFGGLLQAGAICLVLHMLVAYLIKSVVMCQAVQKVVDAEYSSPDDKRPRTWLSWNVMVVLVVGAVYLLANIVPFFTDLVDLLGASATPISCWLIPILLFVRWYKNTPANARTTVGPLEWALIALEVTLALVLMVFGTFVATKDIFEHWHTYGYPFQCHCHGMWDTCACSSDHVGMNGFCPANSTVDQYLM